MTANQKMLITFAVGLAIGAGSAWLWYTKTPGGFFEKEVTLSESGTLGGTEKENEVVTAAATADGTIKTVVIGMGAIVVEDQPAGTRVSIVSLTIPEEGWVAIHEETEGALGNILGAQRFDKGTWSSGEVLLLRGMTEGETYYAVLHADNGDRAFDPHVDIPMRTASGGMVSTAFKAN